MAIGIDITFDDVSPEDCPTNLIELWVLLNATVSGSMAGPFMPYITGAATPSVEDQDKAWMRSDAQGRPLGTYLFYSGTWRKQYAGNTDELRFFMGNPNDHFDGTGKGTPGGNWDGFALCNGQNGTPNLSDKFLVGAKLDNLGTGFPTSEEWTTTVSGESTTSGAGVHEITLTEANTWQKETDAILLGHWDADGNNPQVGGGLIGLSGGGADFNLTEAGGDETPDAIPTLPPWYATAICLWIGYD